ncbi:hypothetical protein [Bacillus subtilis]|uniref:hypothetical protein n=1 Tax=Bacillus subtilis TaxID=1423 RepID=UPI001BA33FAA|nr:hypothetical protein [Bacillus subtilis]CAI6330754.1 hypothetical protein NRS6096_22020 [Bacillus subtilis]
MTFPSKSFKVFPLYRILYEACIDVVGKEKSTLLKVLLRKFIGIKEANSLNRYDFNELIAEMIDNLEKEIEKSSYEEVKMNTHTNERMINIRKHYHKQPRTSALTHISFRISKETISKIKLLKTTTLGEVIELAIANYIVSTEKQVYDLIYLTFINSEE